MRSQNCAATLLLSGTLAVISVACSRVNSLLQPNEPPTPIAPTTTSSPVDTPLASPTPIATASTPQLTAKEAYERAIDAAYSAASIAQSAQSSDDWQLVINRWQDAIELLKEVPSSSSYHALAQRKLSEYQRNLGIAQQQAKRPNSSAGSTVASVPQGFIPLDSSPTPETTTKTNTVNPQVFKAPIKRRVGQIPVIDVLFNGAQTFEMIVDTGASGTVITEEMANRLRVEPTGEVSADTASARGVKFRTGEVQSITVGGMVAKEVNVAIAGSDLDLGLLGQDFFGNYDIWIKQDAVEFHRR